jgi:hypothetical protein
MLLQRGQAKIWPIADSSRTVSRARQVTQVTLKGSTAEGCQLSATSNRQETERGRRSECELPVINFWPIAES